MTPQELRKLLREAPSVYDTYSGSNQTVFTHDIQAALYLLLDLWEAGNNVAKKYTALEKTMLEFDEPGDGEAEAMSDAFQLFAKSLNALNQTKETK